MFRKTKQAWAFLLILLILSNLCAAVLSEELKTENGETIWLTGKYMSPADEKNLRSWQFPYSDDYFLRDSHIYHHDLAKASLGMAVSAFRNTWAPLGSQQENILSYLEQAGFSSIRQDGYDRVPAGDTVSTMIGQKKIGEMTVLAVAVCGGGYGNEWKSNFLVGNETRSVGFNNASQMVQKRIRSYIDSHELSGDLRLWIAGYSRAAAISNITAADMTDTGLFTQVYAYTFATPNVTREKGNYTNIFNIIGKTDPVPCVPLRDWGYAHYGIDLYTPAQEFDSDFAQKAEKSSEVSEKLTGKPLRNNPTINYALRNILDFLLAAYPTPDIYQPTLGQTLIDMWGGDPETNIKMMENVLQNDDSMPEKQRQEFNQLAEYVQDTISYQIRTRERMVNLGLWDETVPLADNVAHEHNPDVYIDWMFSTENPEELFSSDADSYYRFILYGSVTIDIYDAYGYVQRVLPNGEIIRETDSSNLQRRMGQPCPELFCYWENGMIAFLLPKDNLYALSVSSHTVQEINYLATTFHLGTLRGDLGDLHTVTISPGEDYYIIASDEFFSMDEQHTDIVTSLSAIGSYSPSLMIQAESMNVFNLSLPELVLITILMIIVVDIFLFVELLLLIIRLIRHKKRKLWVTIVTHALVSVFFYYFAELSRYYLNAITMVYIIMKSIVALSTAIMSLKAAYACRSRLGWFIFAAMLLAFCGDLNPYPMISLIFFFLCMLMLIFGMLLEKLYTYRRFVVALVLWTALAVVLIIKRHQLGNLFWYFMVYSVLLVLLPVLSWKHHPLLFIGCSLFVISNLVLGVNMVFRYGFVMRAVGVGNYLISTFIISLTPFFMKRRRDRLLFSEERD